MSFTITHTLVLFTTPIYEMMDRLLLNNLISFVPLCFRLVVSQRQNRHNRGRGCTSPGGRRGVDPASGICLHRSQESRPDANERQSFRGSSEGLD